MTHPVPPEAPNPEAPDPTAPAPESPDAAAPATVVLVHGAFADASSWTPVIERLQDAGHTVIAPPNPLRGLRHDAAQLAALLAGIPGPVVLAGHSYGGAVIGEAAAGSPGVRALVYVAAYMPDTGEVLGELAGRFPGSQLQSALTAIEVPGGPDGAPAADLYLRAERFHQAFCHDVPERTARTLAAVQRPLSAAWAEDRAGAAAWRTLPTWVFVATADRGVPAALQRFQAERAGARTVEADTSHLPLYSAPDAVAALIGDAVAGAARDGDRDRGGIRVR
ncbi:alpha/beta hydrolase [Streptomyces sp. NPDC007369]|uniref:alpha/beta fold hydrolase n=1 Tax=Streptomyces sp. NPDC007369 TaxID=3154589 RepID=UPI0033DD49BC